MRFHTSITASRVSPARVSVNRKPNPASPDEVEIHFGGLGVWLSIEEARSLSESLWDAANRARAGDGPKVVYPVGD